MKKIIFILVISFFISSKLPSEEVSFSSPEGWGMSYMSAASLNLSDSFPASLDLGELVITGEISTIPKLNREQQKIGFGGLKYEDLNKSPLFGRGKLKIGFSTPQLRDYFKVVGQPITLILDTNGEVIFRDFGEIKFTNF